MTAPNQQSSQAAILATYLAASAALRSQLLGLIAAAYTSGTNNYGDAAAETFVATAVPAVQAAQQTTAALTSAYLTHLISATAGGSTAPVGVPQDVLSSIRGVDPAEVYRRPYVEVWTELAKGKELPDAVAAGARRAQSIAATDLQLAKTKAAQTVLEKDHRVTGYRRVLVGEHSCALCVLASTRRYTRGDLLPIHPACDCTVFPLFGTEQVPAVHVNELHDAVARDLGEKYVNPSGAKGPIDYRKILVTHDHGELGPVLGVRGQQFTGPSDFKG